MSAIRKLTYADCFIGDKFKSINEFTDLGLPLSVSVWMRLRSSLLFSRKQLSGSTPPEKPGSSITDLLKKARRGSKPFRLIIDKAKYLGDSAEKLTIVSSFAIITNTAIPPPRIVSPTSYRAGTVFSWITNCETLSTNVGTISSGPETDWPT
jgi:hypothetical protein